MAEARIPVKCPHCQALFDVPSDLGGLSIPCKECDERFTAPIPAKDETALAREQARESARREKEKERRAGPHAEEAKSREREKEQRLRVKVEARQQARREQEETRAAHAKCLAEEDARRDQERQQPVTRGDLERLFRQPASEWIGWTIMQAFGFLLLVLLGGFIITVFHDDRESVKRIVGRMTGRQAEIDTRVRVTKDTYTHLLLAANFVVMVTILVELRRRR